jgi:hypothetical protein
MDEQLLLLLWMMFCMSIQEQATPQGQKLIIPIEYMEDY